MIKKRKVVIVGAGNVGASTAFCMINQGICDEIVLIDMNTERAKGETLDMIHSIAFMNRNMEIKSGDYTDCKDADVLVITASAPMGKENDRLVALKSSSKIVTSIVSSAIERINQSQVLFIRSQPFTTKRTYQSHLFLSYSHGLCSIKI